MTYLITYDISNDKKRGKVFRILDKIGIHLQRSVFMVDLELAPCMLLKEKLTKLMSIEDSIIIISLCKSCLGNAQYIGLKENKTLVI
ncbi:MAG: CRISPR-associated endonuclease Cas2 [Deltaproteobacteria bacterium]|jgi:CRISPR-associated protein Cas2|nr:CRISPR-associated endonuclease Cas2 [Deltaproteobacteria bacterium]